MLQQKVSAQTPTQEQLGGYAPESEDGPQALIAWRSAAYGTYASCLAATLSIKNPDEKKQPLSRDMSLESFLDLPDRLTKLWENAVRQCNPQWYTWMEPLTKEGE